MFNLPNLLSFIRMPLALVFLQANPLYRVFAICVAMASDFLDGFIARRYNLVNRVGTLLDPIMDKFFVFFVLCILYGENKLDFWEAAVLMCRDFSVVIYGIYLLWKKRLLNYEFKAIWCGKITTVLQFCILIGLTFQQHFPPYVYVVFLILGLMALGELYQSDRKMRSS